MCGVVHVSLLFCRYPPDTEQESPCHSDGRAGDLRAGSFTPAARPSTYVHRRRIRKSYCGTKDSALVTCLPELTWCIRVGAWAWSTFFYHANGNDELKICDDCCTLQGVFRPFWQSSRSKRYLLCCRAIARPRLFSSL